MNKNDVALEMARKLKIASGLLTAIAESWQGRLLQPNQPSLGDMMAVLIVVDQLSNIKETLTLATGKRTLFKAALIALKDCYLDESSTKADVVESVESIQSAIDTLKGKL